MAFLVPVTDLRSGSFFRHTDGQIYQVSEYQHSKRGRGGAVIKLKAQSSKLKTVREFTFKSGNKIEVVETLRKNMEFVYYDSRKNVVVLAEPETKKRWQVDSGSSIVGEALGYLTEGQEVQVLQAGDEILAIELPKTVELKVAQTGPSEKGDTAGTARKPANLETGAVIQVPMFVKTGDLIRVNTQSGEYVERV